MEQIMNYRSPAGYEAVMALYDRAMEQWPVAYERMSVATRHGDTFVLAWGEVDRPALVLLHGAGTNSAIWAGDAAEYGRHFRVYAVDLIGEAGKSAANRPAWDGPAYCEWLEDVLAGLGVDKATLLGISQGGWCALKFAVTHPDRVERLVLLCPGGVVPDLGSFVVKAVGLSLLGQWGTRRLVRLIFGGRPLPAEVEETILLMTRHFKPRFGVLPLFSDEELGRLVMPVLLLGGGRDALRDMAKIAGRLRPLVGRLEVVIRPEGGHALLETRGVVMGFLCQETAEVMKNQAILLPG